MNNYQNLNEKELKLLCFLAYHGEDTHPSLETEYRRICKTDKKSYDDIIRKLNDEGFILGNTYVNRKWHISVLKELYINHPKWVDTFQHIRTFSRNSVAEYLCQVVKAIISEDYAGAAEITRPHIGLGYRQFNILSYLMPSAKEDIRLIKMLNHAEMYQMLDEVLLSLFTTDELDSSVLDTMNEMIPEDDNCRHMMADMVSAYRYFLYSTPFSASGYPTLWSEAVKGIELAYSKEYEESILSFCKALQAGGTKSNAFDHPVFNYYYGMALIKALNKTPHDANARHRTGRFLQANEIRYRDQNFCINYIIDSLVSDNDAYTKVHILQAGILKGCTIHTFIFYVICLTCHQNSILPTFCTRRPLCSMKCRHTFQ